jgi:putative endonuclease
VAPQNEEAVSCDSFSYMQFFCYILYSKYLDSFYVGYTSDEVEKRLRQHNSAIYGGSSFTARARDWDIYLTIQCNSITQAILIERYIKRMKSKKYIRNLKIYSEMKDKLLEMFD